MSAISRAELDRWLRQDQLNPLYLLIGPEAYLRKEAAQAIADCALRDTLLREFNDSTFSLQSGGAHDAIAAAEQLPMMSSRRVVRITDFGKLRESDENVLVNYLLRPAPSSVVIFIAGDLDKRKKLTKTLMQECVVVDFPPLKDGEAKTWVKQRLSELKLSATEQTLSEFVALVGTDVQTLFSELEKMAAAAADTNRLTPELIDSLIARSREHSNFELGDHLLACNRLRALETLHRLLESGAEPVMLLGLMAGNYHRLALAKDMLRQGSPEDIFRTVPMPFFKRDQYMQTLRKLDAANIARGIQLIADADLAIKTSRASPRLQLEMLVCELTT
ncbi:MAG TPA: DNA polymerase III subunit delta [Pyrinomonadaceae bacterium]|nr:DNA polymerase III subunit delta [Pyrinomonadaceae bacterium]